MKKLLLPLPLCCAAAFTNADPLANQEWVRRNFLPVTHAETDPHFSIWTNTFRDSTRNIQADQNSVTVTASVVSTLIPEIRTNSTQMGLNVWCNDARNYTLFFPDMPEVRQMLPITFRFDLIGVEHQKIYGDTNTITRLPALMKVQEPVPGTLILKRVL